MNKPSAYHIHLLAVLLLTLLILILQKDKYWKPYIYTQEGLISAHAHGFALANAISLKQNPFMAHELDVESRNVKEYNHYPNGHFFIFYVILKIFGNTENTGRTYAIVLNLLGAFLLVLAFNDKSGLTFYSIPMLLLTTIGRDVIPFVFVDASFHFWIGFVAFSVFFVESHDTRKLSRRLFRTACFLSPFFIHLILPFLFFGALARFCFHKSKKELLIDFLFIFIVFVLVFISLCWSQEGLMKGFQRLYAQFLFRVNAKTRYDWQSSLNLLTLLDVLVFKLKHNLLIFWYLLPLSWLYCLVKKKSVLFLVPAIIVHAILFKVYIFGQIFAQYNIILISFMMAFHVASLLSERLSALVASVFNPASENSIIPHVQNSTLIKGMVMCSIYLFSCYEVRTETYASYEAEPLFVKIRDTFSSLKADVRNSKCNCFYNLNNDNVELHTFYLIFSQFYLGDKVISSIEKKEQARCGGIDFETSRLICSDDISASQKALQ